MSKLVKPDLDSDLTPQPGQIWTYLTMFGLGVKGLVKVHSRYVSAGVYYVSGYPDGILQTVSRKDLGKHVSCEMEVIAWAASKR